MPNYPSIYLELQELWKRIRNNDADLAVIKTDITDIKVDILDLKDRTTCITHKTLPYEATVINCSLEQGDDTVASGDSSHAQGNGSQALGNYSHAEGRDTRAEYDYSHSEGIGTIASGEGSHSEGYYTTASGDYSHAQGGGTHGIGTGSHAQGNQTFASGNYSHTEGVATRAIGNYSHAEGSFTVASGNYSHAEGSFTTASAFWSHAEGLSTIASADYQHVQGKYNQTSSTAIMIVGNGTDEDNRSNVLLLTNQTVTFFSTSSVNNFSEQYGLFIAPNRIATPAINIVRAGENIDISALYISENGIQFNDTSGFPHDEGSTLSTYEEGTWTPIASGFTTGSSNGYYTKIGNAVHITLYINSCSLIQSTDYISGLPFQVPTERQVPVNFVWEDAASTTREVINTGFINTSERILMPNINSKDNQILASCTYLTA